MTYSRDTTAISELTGQPFSCDLRIGGLHKARKELCG
jgi:hypothetical protein